MNRLIFKPLGAKLIHIPKGKKEYNAFVERSHQTDDNEFYIPQLEVCRDLKEFLFRALKWQWVYNTIRFHSGIGMTPFKKLSQYVNLSKKIAIFPVVVLDNIIQIIDLFFPNIEYTGYYVLTNDLIKHPFHMYFTYIVFLKVYNLTYLIEDFSDFIDKKIISL
ncbi:MAG: integrase core domain-containing protein [Candidatus Micrarchaeia archaeon]